MKNVWLIVSLVYNNNNKVFLDQILQSALKYSVWFWTKRYDATTEAHCNSRSIFSIPSGEVKLVISMTLEVNVNNNVTVR